MLTLSAAAALAYSPTVAAPHARTSAASVSSRASAPRLGLLQKLGLRRGARCLPVSAGAASATTASA